jgi:hypothetical protein
MSDQKSTLEWKEVVPVHGSQSGISVRQGIVTSLLCNQSKDGPYADEVRGDEIFYRVTDSTNQRSVAALKKMVADEERSVQVFEKLGVNRWADLGRWKVVDVASEDEGCWVFLLHRKR